MSFTDQGKKRSLCLRLSSFIRLVDMLLASAMQSLAVESVAYLRSCLKRVRDKVALAEIPEEDLPQPPAEEKKKDAKGGLKSGSQINLKVEPEAENAEGAAPAHNPNYIEVRSRFIKLKPYEKAKKTTMTLAPAFGAQQEFRPLFMVR